MNLQNDKYCTNYNMFNNIKMKTNWVRSLNLLGFRPKREKQNLVAFLVPKTWSPKTSHVFFLYSSSLSNEQTCLSSIQNSLTLTFNPIVPHSALLRRQALGIWNGWAALCGATLSPPLSLYSSSCLPVTEQVRYFYKYTSRHTYTNGCLYAVGCLFGTCRFNQPQIENVLKTNPE
jgi:hypothetical protein